MGRSGHCSASIGMPSDAAGEWPTRRRTHKWLERWAQAPAWLSRVDWSRQSLRQWERSREKAETIEHQCKHGHCLKFNCALISCSSRAFKKAREISCSHSSPGPSRLLPHSNAHCNSRDSTDILIYYSSRKTSRAISTAHHNIGRLNARLERRYSGPTQPGISGTQQSQQSSCWSKEPSCFYFRN